MLCFIWFYQRNIFLCSFCLDAKRTNENQGQPIPPGGWPGQRLPMCIFADSNQSFSLYNFDAQINFNTLS